MYDKIIQSPFLLNIFPIIYVQNLASVLVKLYINGQDQGFLLHGMGGKMWHMRIFIMEAV